MTTTSTVVPWKICDGYRLNVLMGLCLHLMRPFLQTSHATRRGPSWDVVAV